MKKFTKRELMNRFGRTKEEADIFIEYQRLFPELLEDEEGFIINTHQLWEKLEVKTKYADWTKRKIIKTFEDNYDFIGYWFKNNKKYNELKNENVNLDTGNINQMVRNGYSKVFFCTIDVAKQVAMMENNEIGKLVRKHFILCEKILKQAIEWEKVRNPQKESYKELTATIQKEYYEWAGSYPEAKVYIKEANMLNLSLFGHTSKEMKEVLQLDYEDSLRDNLKTKCNQALDEIQKLDKAYIVQGFDFCQRREMISNHCDIFFKGIRLEVEKVFGNDLKSLF